MKIKVGSFDVLESGNVLVEVGKPLEMQFGVAELLKLIIYFIQDSNKKEFTIESTSPDNSTIELSLYNFITKGVGGGGHKKPLKIGNIDNRALYFSFIVVSITPLIQPVFNYTLYLGEEVADVK